MAGVFVAKSFSCVDAVSVLDAEHSALQRLFERVSHPDENRPDILKQIIWALSSHISAEKQLVVRIVRNRAHGGHSIADELTHYHDEVESILVVLDRRKVNSPDVPEMVTHLLRLTEGHIVEAKANLLPALTHALTSNELTELGERMLSGERRTASHPHPHLPQWGPLRKLSREIASRVDRVRDHSTDIGRSGG